MTYRRDSRYYVPYGRFEPRSARDPTNGFYTKKQRGNHGYCLLPTYQTPLRVKTQLITLYDMRKCIYEHRMKRLVTVVDPIVICHKRNLITSLACYYQFGGLYDISFLRELGKFTDITARGKCEKLLTTNNHTGSAFCKSDCSDDALIATHRFYIAFENSICKDYITEKFFDRISHLLVPIVLKRHIYEDAGVPSNSFIAVDDFGSLEDLGLYLNFLRQNDTAYLRYFDWTKHFRKPNVYRTNAFCKLCEDIHKKTKLSLNDIGKYLDTHECEQNAHFAKFWHMYTKPRMEITHTAYEVLPLK